GTSDHLAQAGVYNIDYIQVEGKPQHDIAFSPAMGNYIEFEFADSIAREEGEPDFYTVPRVPISRAAIVVMSADTLNIGTGAKRIALGNYYDPDVYAFDDRPAIDFLDVPATIGGHLRDEGEPFDLAVYMASNTSDSDVQMNGEVYIWPSWYYDVPATVVADAYDTVRFGNHFLNFLESPYRGLPFRMEVCSRITEWLNQAIANQTLPYADDTGFMEDLLGLEA
ncbi:MAG: hypothetical protein ACYS21_16210, partial [Planctomycetota bacterium]